MEDHVKRLEAAMVEIINNKMNTRFQAAQDSVTELSAQFGSLGKELLQLLRLNRSAPLIVGNSLGQSSVQGQFPREPSLAPEHPGGRPNKAPMHEAEVDEVDLEAATPRGMGHLNWANVEWVPRRGRMKGVRPSATGQNQEFLLKYKSEFLASDYANPRQWILRCEKVFVFSHIPRHDNMNLLYVYLTGKVGLWFESYVHSLRDEFHWPYFGEVVSRRFGDSVVSLMEDFASFKQWGGVNDFTDKYEGFKSLLLQSHPYLTDNYFMKNYIARLKQHLRCFVRTYRPRNLEDAIWFARQYQKGLKAIEGP